MAINYWYHFSNGIARHFGKIKVLQAIVKIDLKKKYIYEGQYFSIFPYVSELGLECSLQIIS